VTARGVGVLEGEVGVPRAPEDEAATRDGAEILPGGGALDDVPPGSAVPPLAGGLLLPLVASSQATAGSPFGAAVWAVLALVLLVAGELVERGLFFAAASGPRMPGVFQ